MPLRAAPSVPPVAPQSRHVDTLLRPLLRRAPSECHQAKTTAGDPSGDRLPDANRKIRSQFRPRLNARTVLSGEKVLRYLNCVEGGTLS